MKLFSRKALVAGAASIALLTGAGATASATEVSNDTVVAGAADKTTNKTDESSKSSSKDGKDVTAKEIREWIGIVTAVIGALTTAFTFVQRFLK